MLCNVEGSELPSPLKSDAFPVILVAAMSASNGYLASLCFMYFPLLVRPTEMAFAGTFMAFCLSSGIAVGSWLSFAVLAISIGADPF